jgi:hypothetical protein
VIDQLDESCDGYNHTYALKVNVTVKDKLPPGVRFHFQTYRLRLLFNCDLLFKNVQSTQAIYYKGLKKFLYLPDIFESKEVLRLLEHLAKTGKLFKTDYDKQLNQCRVVLNPLVFFKTQLHGGGKFV